MAHAFPTDIYYNEKRIDVSPGMSLRDYFAAAALASPMAHSPNVGDIAAFAYKVADAMIEARRPRSAAEVYEKFIVPDRKPRKKKSV
jgi:hypothetical protein